jgi:hypothetical protein
MVRTGELLADGAALVEHGTCCAGGLLAWWRLDDSISMMTLSAKPALTYATKIMFRILVDALCHVHRLLRTALSSVRL